MPYHVLATDYDGTLARDGRVEAETITALEQLRATGRKLILVTGRETADLLPIFPHITLIDSVVAENGAVLYRPATQETTVLSEGPPQQFVRELRQRGVTPLAIGRVVVATWHPHENTVLNVIREQGLELHVIFNKDAVMVLPSGVNKASGLADALKKMDYSAHEVVGIGDAENDHAFLKLCECSVAVANALPAVKERADFVTRGDHGAGVRELIRQLIASDLADRDVQLTRHHLVLGTTKEDKEVYLSPWGRTVLIAGPSGSGKSTAATSFLEQLIEKHYQFCIIDPEGDYDNLATAVTVGGEKHEPKLEEILQLLKDAEKNVVVNLIGLPLADRPRFFLKLLPRLQEMRGRTGRPHWLVVDETQHLLPAAWEPAQQILTGDLKQVVLITVHPSEVSPLVLGSVDLVMAVGQHPEKTVQELRKVLGDKPPSSFREPTLLQQGEVLVWPRYLGQAPYSVRIIPPRLERRRHVRKYAEGELPPERSFFFKGPEGKLNLRAQNLLLFLQLAEGVDDETWEYHLRRGDYSGWFRTKIKDETLADEVAKVESRRDLDPKKSRALIKGVIEKYCTLPATTSGAAAGSAS
jgi:HAD superfamily hydrolase (TIGR01484 family)